MPEHRLRHRSSFIVVILRSLRHGACVCCGKPIRSLDESFEHWEEKLTKPDPPQAQLPLWKGDREHA